MSQWQALPIVGGSYKDDTRPWSVQDTINMIPVAAEKHGTRSPSILRCAPGFAVFSASAQSAPCRGLHNVEGTLFGVIGDKLYTFALDGTATALGAIPGVERVSMAHNQIANGNQLAIAANNAGYVYDTVLGTLTQISDEGFPGSIAFAFIDQYIVGIDPSRNFAFNSMLADATSYNTLDRMQAEAQPDKLVGLAVTHDELWLFGERTIQPFHDTGAAQAPFEAGSNMVVEIGCASRDSIRNMDNSVFWLGNDGIVYRANGYAPQRISTHAVEQAISRCNRNGAFAFTFEDRGHKVYYLTFPGGQTWGYDAASDEWHRRQSYGLDRWRINDLVYWNGKWIGGDYANGKLYVLDWNLSIEDVWPLERRRITGVSHANQNALIVNALELVVDTGEAYPNIGPRLAIRGDLPDGRANSFPSFSYAASNAVGNVAYAIETGALPAGLVLQPSGQITGKRTTQGAYSWTVVGTDQAGRVARLADSSTTTAPYAWAFKPSTAISEQIGRLYGAIPDTTNSKLLCLSDNTLYTSADALAWAAVPTKFPTSDQGRGIAVLDDAWVCIGNDGSNNSRVYRTLDSGSTWTELKYNGTSLTSCKVIAGYGGTLLAMGATQSPPCLLSLNKGDTWTTVSTPAAFNPDDSILGCYPKYIPVWGKWFIPGQSKIYEADGLAPSAIVESLTSTDRVGGCAYSPELDTLVVVGYFHAYKKTGKTGAWVATDLTGIIPSAMFDVAWHPALGLFVANAQASVIFSPDGISWASNAINLVGGGTTNSSGAFGVCYVPWIGQIVLTSGTPNTTTLVSTV